MRPFELESTAAGKSNPCEKAFLTAGVTTNLKGFSLGETIQGIDHFYQNTPENAPMPVFMAARYVALTVSDDVPRGIRDSKYEVRRT